MTMDADAQAAPSVIFRLVSWLTPAQPAGDEPDDHEDRLLVIFGLITLPFSILYAVVSHVIGFQVGVVLMLACFVLLVATLRLFQVTGRFRLCANLYLVTCFMVAVLGCSFFSGGIHSMVTPWFTLAPVISVLLLEQSQDTVAWALLTCAAIVAYGVADAIGFQFPMLYDRNFKAFFDTICIVGLAMFLSWAAFMFGRNRKRAMATISEQKASLQRAVTEIERLAYYDMLTELPNRRLFMDRLGQVLAMSTRNGCYAALMFLDLDNFKPLNDMHGHAAGDLLLVQVAQRLTNCIREADTLARFGGDEFAVILSALGSDLPSAQCRANIVAEKIAAALAEPFILELPTTGTVYHHCTASIGVVMFRNHDSAQKDLLNWADAAMYRAKSAGKNVTHFHSANDPLCVSSDNAA